MAPGKAAHRPLVENAELREKVPRTAAMTADPWAVDGHVRLKILLAQT